MILRMKPIPFYIPGILRFSLLFLLLILSLAIIFTTNKNVQDVNTLAIQSLENTADGLSLAAEYELRSAGEKDSSEIRKIFSDRIVAYALIARQDGTILFHTNPALKNTKLFSAQEMEKWISDGENTSGRITSSGRITLGTGMPAYEFNIILSGTGTSPEMLQLVLNTTEADNMIRQAGRMWWITGMLIGILWAAGILFDRFVTNRIKTQAVRENQKRMTLIGQMTASLAHEIRNALGSIKGYAQWLEEKATEGSPQKEALTTVVTGARRIEALVNELLLFSREEAYHDEPVTLEPLINEALAASAPGRSAGIEMNIPPGTSVRADREKLLRVIVNGIRNAMDAMVEDGSLRIYSYETSRWVSIYIEDTGEGITEKDHDRLFTPFYTTKTDGTGLGLAYAKKVVEGMGGTIKLTNRAGGVGAVLKIQLPNGRNKKNGI
jgi:signal transduction histidine kinase